MKIIQLTIFLILTIPSMVTGQKRGELVGVKQEIKPINTAKETPKGWKMFFWDLKFIPGGTAALGSGYYVDSTISMNKRLVSISSFYISATEVTNGQYRFFCQEIAKKHGKDSAAKLLPDTLCWSIFPASEPMSTYYFAHPAYDGYPVVGVSYVQAVTFTRWLSNELNENQDLKAFREKGALGSVHLPSEMEWMYAAAGITEGVSRNLFPWSGSFLKLGNDGSFKLMANGGALRDSTGLTIIDYMTDGGFMTSKPKTFPPNAFGLYDMAGNVNEWVSDAFIADPKNVAPDGAIFRRNNLENDYKVDTTDSFLTRPNNRVIKGGSYMDIPYFLTWGSRRGVPESTQRPDLGFRIAVSISGNSFDKISR